MLDATAVLAARNKGCNRVLGYTSGKTIEGVEVFSLLGLLELVAEGS